MVSDTEKLAQFENLYSWLDGFPLIKLKEAKKDMDEITKDFSAINNPYTGDKKDDIIRYILCALENHAPCENPTDWWIWYLGMYYFKTQACPVWGTIYFENNTDANYIRCLRK
jgi:hypothetical protein